MSNVNLAETASTTTYAVSLEQVALLIAANLQVPVDCIDVRYKLASTNYDGPGYSSQYVECLEVVVNNQMVTNAKRRHGIDR